MIKVVYDYQVFEWQKYGGVSRYIWELATHLAQDQAFGIKILAMLYVNEYLKQADSDLVVGFPVPKVPKTGTFKQIINANLSKLWLNFDPPDIIHNTYYKPHKLAPKNTKLVTTVHDMLHEKFRQYFPDPRDAQGKAESVKRADHIICVSESTKKDLIEILDVNPNKISVVYHGSSLGLDQTYSSEKKASYPYILYVGDRGGYKNFQCLLKAYACSSKLKNNFKLVCFGRSPFSPEELDLINGLELSTDQVLQVSGDDLALANYYQGASVFVYPSLYEGFGIPLIEAMSLRCPVVCSNTSCLPEVAGDAAEFFDPYEPENIADALERILYSSERAAELVKLGTQRAKKFTWQACAEQTRSVYLSLT